MGNSDKQQQFRNLLYCLCDGESTRSNWELLMTRIPENIFQSERIIFSDPSRFNNMGRSGKPE